MIYRRRLRRAVGAGLFVSTVLIVAEYVVEAFCPQFRFEFKPFHDAFEYDPILYVRLLLILLTPLLVTYIRFLTIEYFSIIEHSSSKNVTNRDSKSLKELRLLRDKFNSIFDNLRLQFLFGGLFLLFYTVAGQFAPLSFGGVAVTSPILLKVALYPIVNYSWAFILGIWFYLFIFLVWALLRLVTKIAKENTQVIPENSIDPFAPDEMGGYGRIGSVALVFYLLIIVLGATILVTTRLFSPTSPQLAVFGLAFYVIATGTTMVAALASVSMLYVVHAPLAKVKEELLSEYSSLVKQADSKINAAFRRAKTRIPGSLAQIAMVSTSLHMSYDSIKKMKTWVVTVGGLSKAILVSLLSYAFNLLLLQVRS